MLSRKRFALLRRRDKCDRHSMLQRGPPQLQWCVLACFVCVRCLFDGLLAAVKREGCDLPKIKNKHTRARLCDLIGHVELQKGMVWCGVGGGGTYSMSDRFLGDFQKFLVAQSGLDFSIFPMPPLLFDAFNETS